MNIDRIKKCFANTEYYSRLCSGFSLGCGFETQAQPSSYYWDGLKRGGNPNSPHLVFQYTLQGAGIYETDQRSWRLEPEHAFFAVVPSAHRYYFPENESRWTYFWIIIHHDYLVSRVLERQAACGSVLKFSSQNPLFFKSLELLEYIVHPEKSDEFGVEELLLSWLMQYERLAHHAIYPQLEGTELFESTRKLILENLDSGFGVNEVALYHEMSRSHFSHYFKNKTGQSPSAFITRVRLEEVTRRLLNSNDKLETIADETGFADANHLCKVFRRHFYTSPGLYRKGRA